MFLFKVVFVISDVFIRVHHIGPSVRAYNVLSWLFVEPRCVHDMRCTVKSGWMHDVLLQHWDVCSVRE